MFDTKEKPGLPMIRIVDSSDSDNDVDYAIDYEPGPSVSRSPAFESFQAKKHIDKRPPIKRIIIMGDSLSDRGFMEKDEWGGFIPMNVLSGLKGKSPDGRFTNGYTWSDALAAILAAEFKFARVKTYNDYIRNDDKSDGLLAHDHKLLAVMGDDPDNCLSQPGRMKRSLSEHDIHRENKPVQAETPHHQDFNLDDYLGITYNGKTWIRSFCKGGLMAYDYAWKISNSISRFFSRLILPTLDGMRRMLLESDLEIGTTWADKQTTMIIEWSGANDLITVNREPSEREADNAVAARIKNMRKLIHAGYKHFTLFNLPDLSLTPRFQAKSQADRDNAARCSDYFNARLAGECIRMANEFPDCNITVLDINSQFKEMYNNPEKYGFDRDKLTTPFTLSKDFRIGCCLVKLDQVPDHFDSLNLPTGFESYFMQVEGEHEALYFVDQTNKVINRLVIPADKLAGFANTLANIDKNEAMDQNHYNQLISLTGFTPPGDGMASPSTGYMFWDDVHPGSDTQVQNGVFVRKSLDKHVRCVEPDSLLDTLKHQSADNILTAFKKSYRYQLAKDRGGPLMCLGGHSRLDINDASLSLADVLYHALHNRGTRTKQTLTKLGLLDKDGKPMTAILAIEEAMQEVDSRLAGARLQGG